jgi:hypothetical protein
MVKCNSMQLINNCKWYIISSFDIYLIDDNFIQGKECPPRHMGIGSAIHLSGNGDPGLFLMKKYGVVEQNQNNIFSSQLIQGIFNQILILERNKITIKNFFITIEMYSGFE